MPHPDEGTIHAWLDGELDATESARIETLVQSNLEWAAAAAEARGLVAASSRIIAALDQVGDAAVPGEAKTPSEPTPRRSRPWWMMRTAALLVVVAGTAIVLRRTAPEEAVRPAPNALLRAEPEAELRTAPTQQEKNATDPVRAKVAREAERRTVSTAGKPTGPRDRPGAPVLSAPVMSAPVMSAPVVGAVIAGSPVVGAAPRAAGTVAAEAMPKPAAKDEQVPRITCYEIVERPLSDLDKSARVSALVAPRTVVRADSLSASVVRKMLVLAEPTDRFRSEVVPFADRSVARTPTVTDPRAPVPGLARKQRPDTILITWSEGGETMTAKAASRGDTLVGSASVAGGAPRAFRAVRTACPGP